MRIRVSGMPAGVSTADSARPPVCGAGRADGEEKGMKEEEGEEGQETGPAQPAPGEGRRGRRGQGRALPPPGLLLDLRRLPQRHCSICEPFSRRSPRILMDFTLWRPPVPRKRDRPRSGRLSAAGHRPFSPPNFPAHRPGPAAPRGGNPPPLLRTSPPGEDRLCREGGRAGWKDVKP